MKKIHFVFEDKEFSYGFGNCSNFPEEIYNYNSDESLGIDNSELVIENPNGVILKFLPCRLKISPNDIGLVFSQYQINFLQSYFNSQSNPYKILIRPFDIDTTQIDCLCVAWKPISRTTDSIFKLLSCTENNFDDLTFQYIKHVNIKSIESAFVKGDEIYHKSTSDGTIWKKLILPLRNDCMFHYADNSSGPILTFNEFLISLPATKETSGPSLEILASSFNKKVLNQKDKQKNIILNYLNDSMELYKTASLFSAPFVTICQSSGVGKSKFVLECGEEIPLIYGVFRAGTDKSYPLMSDWIGLFVEYVFGSQNITDSFPDKNKYDITHAEKFSMGRVLIYFDALLIAYRALFEKLRKEGKAIADAFKEINWKFHTSEGQSEFASYVKVKMDETFSQIFNSIRVTVDYFKQLMPEKHKKSPFVIVLDELSLLLEIDFPGHDNLFDIIRRSLYLLPAIRPIDLLIVGIGTNGDVSVFYRELGDDSLRFVGKSLFLPSLILGGNWDIFKKFIKLNNFKFTGLNVKNSKMIKLICSFGRALWSSLPFVDVITVAQKKLLNGGSEAKLFTKLAIWSIRTSLSLNSDLALSRTLLRSYMAIAYSVSYDAETMNIGYPSEPILAIAARELTKSSPDFSFHNLLNVLLEFVQLRPVDKGELTEIIFAQIVLMAIDNADNAASSESYHMSCEADDVRLNQIFNSEIFLLENLQDIDPNNMNVDSPSNDSHLSPIQDSYHITTVDSFLKTLYGDVKGVAISDSLGESLRFGIINASHVISALNSFPYEKVYNQSEMESFHHRETEEEKAAGAEPEPNGEKEKEPKGEKEKENFEGDVIDQALLRNLFIRQAALKTPPRYYGLDMCIPVLMKRPSDSEEAEGVFGYIGMQFKSTYVSEAGVIAKMDPAFHYVRCGAHKDCQRDNCQFRTNDQDLGFIFKNHLLLYMAASHVEEKINNIPERVQPARNCKTVDIDIVMKDSVVVPFYEGVVPYHVTRSIQELAEQSKLLTSDDCGLIQNIIHAQPDPFKNIEELQFLKVADNLLTMSSLRYLEADGDLRTARGMKALPDPFLDCERKRWSDPITSKSYFITRTSKGTTLTRKTLAKKNGGEKVNK